MSKVHKLTYIKEMVDLVDETNPPGIEIHGKKFVQVVRCKDCVSYEAGWCYVNEIKMGENDYCSWGKRREDVQESD